MRLFLIRHAECVNFASQGGPIDTPLTTHGAVQSARLAERLAAEAVISHVFSSPLLGSMRTAEAIREAQSKAYGRCLAVIQVRELQGGEHLWSHDRKDQPPVDNTEWMHEMRLKADNFLDDYLIPLLCCDDDEACVVVAQGDELSALAKAFFDRIPRGDIVLPPEPEQQGLTMDNSEVLFPPWSLTGVLDVSVSRSNSEVVQGPKLPLQARIQRVNCRTHLDNLQKTRGGIGSCPFDEKQLMIHDFFTPLPKATPGPGDHAG